MRELKRSYRRCGLENWLFPMQRTINFILPVVNVPVTLVCDEVHLTGCLVILCPFQDRAGTQEGPHPLIKDVGLISFPLNIH